MEAQEIVEAKLPCEHICTVRVMLRQPLLTLRIRNERQDSRPNDSCGQDSGFLACSSTGVREQRSSSEDCTNNKTK